jgi:hypothetical protein
MDAAEQLARDRGIATLGITVGLFDDYGPAQRLYARRGYIPDGRGACQGQRALHRGTRVRMDDDLIIWLTKGSRQLTTRYPRRAVIASTVSIERPVCGSATRLICARW